MISSDEKSVDLKELINLLNEDRALILEMIDQGHWADLRYDLAALERELGQLLTRAVEKLEEEEKRS